MRISEQISYPHPVLSEETDDYLKGAFSIQFKVTESRTTGKVILEYEVNLIEPSLEHLLEDNQAMIGIFIVCLRTYYNVLHEINRKEGKIEFSKGELKDDVSLRPIICAIDKINNYSTNNLHAELREINWSFNPSDILALGKETLINVGLEKLSPIETIFNLVVKEEVPEGLTQINLDEEKIEICANRKTCDGIHAMRGCGTGRVALLNGVYLPVVMEVLSVVSSSPELYTNKRWFSVFSAKCKHLNVAIPSTSIYEDAQKLLLSPLSKMLKSKEFAPS